MTNAEISELKTEARSMKLVYTPDSLPGYTRRPKDKHFIYFDTEGVKINDVEEIQRINSLAIPPAWENVWICPKPNGHLQATGIDTAGRKQYKYHSKWSTLRNERKHNRMAEFAKALPIIRKKVEQDILNEQFNREKVVAIAIAVMDKTFIRVGNESYTKLYGSYGLTSLRNKHVKIKGNKMIIAFRGKKGVFQEIELTHSRLVRMMSKLKDIPGQELFQYYDEDGHKKTLDSDSINSYLEESSGKDFTAKDFRTWSGTVQAFGFLANLINGQAQDNTDKNIIAALDFVAKKLGNTRTVCKKYYVHPKLFTAYSGGKLQPYFTKLDRVKHSKAKELHEIEEKLIAEFIEKEC